MSSKPAPVALSGQPRFHRGTLSDSLGIQAKGYQVLPDFPTVAPPTNVREVKLPGRENNKNVPIISESESESESESDSESETETSGPDSGPDQSEANESCSQSEEEESASESENESGADDEVSKTTDDVTADIETPVENSMKTLIEQPIESSPTPSTDEVIHTPMSGVPIGSNTEVEVTNLVSNALQSAEDEIKETTDGAPEQTPSSNNNSTEGDGDVTS